MKIVKVTFNRKFNLGNYESLDAGMEAEIGDNDNPQEILTVLRDNVEMWFVAEKNKQATQRQETHVEQPKHQTAATDPYVWIRTKFSKEIEDRLDFTLKDGKILIRPTTFLGSDIFAQVLAVVRSLGGEYVSAGKDSHWEVTPK